MSSHVDETAPAAPSTSAASKRKTPANKAKQVTKNKPRKSKGPGKYSQLVIDTIRDLGERGGVSLVKIYKEARKVSWFDQQHGRVYLRSSIRALLLNDTLVQVKGLGANGSFRLNKDKVKTKKTSSKPRKTAKAIKKPSVTAGKKKPTKAKKAPKQLDAAAKKKKKMTKRTKRNKKDKKN